MTAPRITMRLFTLALVSLFAQFSMSNLSQAQVFFQDDFEGDLSKWSLIGAESISQVDSGVKEHGRVLALNANGKVLALVPGSDTVGAVRLEMDILFPDDGNNYLGVVYNYTNSGLRTDFGSLYIKGNGSYIRANPWRDGNVSRLLYEEYKTKIDGENAIQIGAWQRVKAEIEGNNCHLYVGDMTTPKITFDLYEGNSGLIGLNPRIAAFPVWVDNVQVSAIKSLAYTGPDLPAISYAPEQLLTNWQYSGPYPAPVDEIEGVMTADGNVQMINNSKPVWNSFSADPRGAIVTGKVSEYEGTRPVAYFRTNVHSKAAKSAVLHFSTLDEISLWVNDVYHGFVYRNGYMFGNRDWNAWHDFYKTPEHAGRRVPVNLMPGDNEILLRVRNGQFASGGFFARLEETGEGD